MHGPMNVKYGLRVCTAVSRGIMVFGRVMSCSWVDINNWQKPTISMFRLKSPWRQKRELSSKHYYLIYQITRCHIPQDLNILSAYIPQQSGLYLLRYVYAILCTYIANGARNLFNRWKPLSKGTVERGENSSSRPHTKTAQVDLTLKQLK
jgi:hypothetical protein